MKRKQHKKKKLCTSCLKPNAFHSQNITVGSPLSHTHSQYAHTNTLHIQKPSNPFYCQIPVRNKKITEKL